MKKKNIFYIIWALLYVLCVIFSFVVDPITEEKTFLALLSICFFIPPYWLFFLAKKENDRKTLRILRLISMSVIILTPILLILNILSVNYTSTFGLVVYILLVLFSTPLATCSIWFWALFLWAVLMILTLQKKRPDHK